MDMVSHRYVKPKPKPPNSGPHGGFVWNTTFERVNGLLPPNLGAGQTGIMIQNVTGGITIGDVSTAGHGNFFSNLLYGIRTNASRTFIQNNSFQNMLPQSFALNPQGAAVYAQGNSDLAYLRVDNLNSVQNARWGVYSQGVMESYVEDNSFKKLTAAAVMTVSNKHQVMVTRNVVHDFQLMGIAGVDNGGSHFLESNTITNPNPVQNSLGTAISYQNAITGMTLKITNDNKTQNVRTGIHAVNIGLLTVEGNPDINFSPGSSTAPGYGVRLANCQNALVRQNKVWGSLVNNDRGRPNTYCLHVSNSPGARFELNDLRNAGKGYWGTGVLTNDNLICNTFTNLDRGVELNNVSSFGPVVYGATNPSDNQWRNTGPQAVGDDVICTGNTPGNTFVWRVRANSPGTDVTVPNPSTFLPFASAIPFIPPFATGASPCNPGPIANPGNGGGQGQNLCQDPPCRDMKFLPIVMNQLQYPAMQQENEWHGRYFSFRSFYEDPSWLNLGVPDDTLYQDFYNITRPSSIGKIVEIEEKLTQDSFVVASNMNAWLVASITAESNFKRLTEIYLNTWAMGVDTFTNTEQSDLLNIAYQCPISGGHAVYGARVMLGLDLADSCNMTSGIRIGYPHPNRVLDSKQKPAISPNPNTGTFSIWYDPLFENGAEWILMDLRSVVVCRGQIQPGSRQAEIVVGLIPNGTYMLELRLAKFENPVWLKVIIAK